jgi:hypothetical protein
MTSMVAAIVRFCQRSDVPSKLAHHVVVRSLPDEVLWWWFPRLQSCYGTMGIVGADAVTVPFLNQCDYRALHVTPMEHLPFLQTG